MNERIRAPQVRVIDGDGNQLGIMEIAQARRAAEEAGLDLIEVAPEANPPVCRLLDWGRFRYEQKKKAKEAQKKSKQVEVKNIRVRPNTDDHDLDFKSRNAIKFLRKGHKVNFTVIFRGPELRHKDIGRDQLLRIAEGCLQDGDVEVQPHMEGRRMLMLIAPKPGGSRSEDGEEPEDDDADDVVDDLSVDDISADEAPVDEAPVDDISTDEAPAETDGTDSDDSE